jgi:hypothetical protein
MRAPKSGLFLLPIFLLCVSPLFSQVHGIPASVTSFGFGGNISPAPGVAASVTSLGPNGFNFVPSVNGRCCFNTFFPGHQFSSFPEDQFRSRLNFRSLNRRHHFGPIFTPSYAVLYPYPVAVPYAVGDDEQDEDYASDNAMSDRPYSRPARPPQDRRESPDAIAPESDRSAPVPQAVAAQPSTILIFKDGHQLDVENYAIVGETLFEFSNGLAHKFQLADLDLPATEKANEDRGVEFQAPPAGAQ